MQINETDREIHFILDIYDYGCKVRSVLGTLKHWFNELSVGLKSYLEEPGLNHNSQG